MKLLVNNFQIKATYKNGAFFGTDGKKIDDSEIQKIIIDFNEFKELNNNTENNTNQEKKSKKTKKDE